MLANGDPADEITKLKNEDGDNIIAYGGALFVASLIKQGLIDEFHVLVNPTAIGNGLPFFNKLNRNFPLTSDKCIAFDCGVVLLHYEPKQD